MDLRRESDGRRRDRVDFVVHGAFGFFAGAMVGLLGGVATAACGRGFWVAGGTG